MGKGKGAQATQTESFIGSGLFSMWRHDAFTPLLGQMKVALFMSLWLTSSVTSLFLSKRILHVFQINEAVFTLWQFALSVLFGMLFTKVFRFQPLASLSSTQFRAVIPLSMTFLVKEVLKYVALSRVSVNLVNTIRSLGPLFNVILEYLWFGHRPPTRVLWALAPIVLGVTLTSVDEINVASESDSLLIAIMGFLAATLSTAINNGQNIYSKILFGREHIDPVSLQIYLSAISLALMSPFTLIPIVYHSLHEVGISQKFVLPSRAAIAGLIAAGFCNFIASQLAFNTLRLVSPLSYSVANTFKRVAIAMIAIFFFSERLSVVNGIGILVSIVGIFIYERQARSLKQARQYRMAPNQSINRPTHTMLRKPTASGADLLSMALEQEPTSLAGNERLNKDTSHRHFALDVCLSPKPQIRQTQEHGSARASQI